jgi:hypothetical protein
MSQHAPAVVSARRPESEEIYIVSEQVRYAIVQALHGRLCRATTENVIQCIETLVLKERWIRCVRSFPEELAGKFSELHPYYGPLRQGDNPSTVMLAVDLNGKTYLWVIKNSNSSLLMPMS